MNLLRLRVAATTSTFRVVRKRVMTGPPPPSVQQSQKSSFRRLLDFGRRWPMDLYKTPPSLRRVANQVAALRVKLLRSHRLLKRLMCGKKKMVPVAPVLTESELQGLREQLRELHLRWEREGSAVVAVSQEQKPQSDTGFVRMTELPAKMIAESIAMDVKKVSGAITKHQAMEVVSTLKTFAQLVPQLPFFVTTVVQDFLFLREQEKGKNKKKNSKKNEEDTKLQDQPTESPHWKRHVGGAVVAKTTVDARTRYCVDSLRNAVFNDTICLRRLETFCAHLHQYPYAKGVAVRENVMGELLDMRRRTENEAVVIQANEALDLVGHHDPCKGRGIRILSLDGGGMRGVVPLEVLAVIEKKTGKKIYELFDFMCGVSTGSIIMALLAFHKYSVNEIEDIYNELGRRVFSQNLLLGTRGWVMSHSYYNTQLYEECLRSSIGDTKLNETLRSANTPKVAIISTLVSGHNIRPYVFRNYQYPVRTQSFYRGSARYKIWEAVRASTAAPGYFDEFSLRDKIHHDGAIMTNNATIIAIHEAQRLWPNEELSCLVSLGTGRHERPITFTQEIGPPKALSLAQKFSRVVDAATDTEINHVTLRDLLPGTVYYRFNPFLSDYFPLDEVREEKVTIMRNDTRMYLRRNSNRIDEACNQLMLPRRRIDEAKDAAQAATEIAKAKLEPLLLRR